MKKKITRKFELSHHPKSILNSNIMYIDQKNQRTLNVLKIKECPLSKREQLMINPQKEHGEGVQPEWKDLS